MFRLVASTDLMSLSLAEARRLVSDATLAAATDLQTRALAWATCMAARRGRATPVLMLLTIDTVTTPEPPKDAA